MKNKGIYIVSGLIVLVGGYFIYNKFYKTTPKTKEDKFCARLTESAPLR